MTAPACMLARGLRWFAVIALLAAGMTVGLPAHASPGMPNISGQLSTFEHIPSSDISNKMLGQIVGPAWNKVNANDLAAPLIPNTRDYGNNKTPDGLLAVISSSLDAACLVLAVLILLWSHGAFSALNAAKTGTTGSYNTLWGPFRAVLTFGLLVPVLGGYCVAQVVVMKAAHLSIGMADAAYSEVMDYIAEGNPISNAMIASDAPTAENILRSLVCADYLNTYDPGSVKASGVYTPQPTTIGGIKTYYSQFAWTSTPGSGLPSGSVCGGYRLAESSNESFAQTHWGLGWISDITGTSNGTVGSPIDRTRQYMIDTKARSIETLISQLNPIAQGIVKANAPPKSKVPGVAANAGSTGLILFRKALNNYQDADNRAASTAVSTLNGLGSNQKKSEMMAPGWVYFGAFFWNLAALNTEAQTAINQKFQTKAHILSPTAPSFRSNPLASGYQRVEYTTAAFMHELAPTLPGIMNQKQLGGIASNLGTDRSQEVGLASRLVSDLGNDIVNGFRDSITKGNVVTNVESYGQDIFGVGATVFATSIGLQGGGDVLKAAGALGPEGSVISKLGAVGGKIGALLMVVAGPLVLIGLFLGFYLPFIPIFIWIMAVLSWLLMFLKALLAMPVWAAAHCIPEGEGWAGQSARQGYMLILALVLTPTLLLGGQLCALLLMNVFMQFMTGIYVVAMKSVMADSTIGIFTAIVIIAIYVFMVVTVASRCFALTTELRDEILGWIGGGGQSFGDDHGLHQAARGALVGTVGGHAISAGHGAHSALGADKAKK